jgi:hypothetical protein
MSTPISIASYCFSNKATRAKRDKIIAIVRENPQLTGAEIIRQYHPENSSKDSQKRTRAMLQTLCADRRLKYLEGDRYVVLEATQIL